MNLLERNVWIVGARVNAQGDETVRDGPNVQIVNVGNSRNRGYVLKYVVPINMGWHFLKQNRDG
jgi:hypothetical protein